MAVGKPGRPKELRRRAILQVTVDATVKETLERIAQREKTTVSKLLRPEVELYAKAHARGNEQYSLDPSIEAEDFHALPTIWEEPTRQRLHGISKEDRKNMMEYMEKWWSALDNYNKARGE